MNVLNNMDRERAVITHSKPHITAEDRRTVDTVLSSDMIAEGKLVERFEREVSRYMGLAGGVAASSGTSALFMVLKGLGIGQGDEVILPSYVCRSVWEAVAATGAQPVLCDIEEDWCMSIDTVRPRVTRRTKAVILVHIFGIVADADGIFSLGIPVIEDCCQAIGATHGGRMAGTLGQACVLSFHATKLLTTGEGGMVLTNDAVLLRKMRELKQGSPDRLTIRFASPMTDIQAALGLSQLARYSAFLDRRRTIADYYFSALDGLLLSLPRHVRNRSIFFRFPVRTKRGFEELQRMFYKEGIHVRRGVDTLLHRLCSLNPDDFPVTERIFSETLSIPIYPALSDKDCERIVGTCHAIFKKACIGAT